MQNLPSSESVIDVDIAAVRAVMKFAACDDVRFYLNAVRVEPDGEGAIVVATNGHVLLAARDRFGIARQAVSVPINAKRNRGAVARAGRLRMTPEGVIWAACPLGRSVHFVLPDGKVDGTYPEWRALIGTAAKWTPGLSEAGFAADYVHWVLQLAVRGTDGCLRFYHDGDKTLFTLGRNMFGLLMPMRGGAALHDVLPFAAAGEG